MKLKTSITLDKDVAAAVEAIAHGEESRSQVIEHIIDLADRPRPGNQPTAMKRSVRLYLLVQHLGGRRAWHPEEIAEHFQISVRTAYRDIADLSSVYSIPVTTDDEGRYRLVEGATMRLLPLTATERELLTLALDNPALRTAPDVAAAVDRLGDKLNAATRQVEETAGGLALAGPEKSGDIKEGLVLLLNGAVRDRTPVSFRYRSLASGRTTRRGLDPYRVFHRENAWYVVGHCHRRQELRAFRLDRIAHAELTEGTFAPPDFRLADFLEHSWGIYHGRTVHEVVIHFDPALAALIEESTHHPGQQVVRLGNGDLEYRVSLSHLEEIARWIVGFAGAARAVEPPPSSPWSRTWPPAPTRRTGATTRPRRPADRATSRTCARTAAPRRASAR